MLAIMGLYSNNATVSVSTEKAKISSWHSDDKRRLSLTFFRCLSPPTPTPPNIMKFIVTVH